MTYIYFISCDFDGECRSQFIESSTPKHAVEVWRDNLGNEVDGDDFTVYKVPSPTGEDRPILWHEDIHPIDMKPDVLCERCGSGGPIEDWDGEGLCEDCAMDAQDGSLYDD